MQKHFALLQDYFSPSKMIPNDYQSSIHVNHILHISHILPLSAYFYFSLYTFMYI